MKTSEMMLRAILENPNDLEPRRLYAEALIEEGFPLSGEQLWQEINEGKEYTTENFALFGEAKSITCKGFVSHIETSCAWFMDSAKRLFGLNPITSVELRDRLPDFGGDDNICPYSWGNESLLPRYVHRHCVPKEIFIIMSEIMTMPMYLPDDFAQWLGFARGQDALDCCSQALVIYGRKQAGLRTLPITEFRSRWRLND